MAAGGSPGTSLQTMSASTWRVLVRPALDVEDETSCGTSVAEAREALRFWRSRRARLPWYRRAARAEAIEMAGRWQRRLVQAELERWRLRGLTRTVLAVVTWWGPRRVPSARRVARLALLATRVSATARLVAMAAAAVVVAALAVTVLAAVVIAQAV
jgi:hypothetical protein